MNLQQMKMRDDRIKIAESVNEKVTDKFYHVYLHVFMDKLYCVEMQRKKTESQSIRIYQFISLTSIE